MSVDNPTTWAHEVPWQTGAKEADGSWRNADAAADPGERPRPQRGMSGRASPPSTRHVRMPLRHHGHVSEPPDAVEDLAAEYRAILEQMHTQRIENGGKPRAWNRLVDRMQAVHLRLRTTPAGRDAITSSINDVNPTVRSWSAVNALGWAEGVARGGTRARSPRRRPHGPRGKDHSPRVRRWPSQHKLGPQRTLTAHRQTARCAACPGERSRPQRGRSGR